ncbi:unnamed protein product, partial [Mesorhabditis belari]|uniref:Aminopeptidase n=1 Tax=Mesorhabditis belari TaxID=2138241 RepID=A0AAF3FRF3_9BILA
MAMEEIDLSDRRGLIAMAYGNPKEGNKSLNTSTSTIDKGSDKAPLTNINGKSQERERERERDRERGETREPRKKKRISCAYATCLFLLLCAILACLLSALITYGLTKQAFDRDGDVLPFVPDPRYNLTQEEALLDEEEEEERDLSIPPMADLRLPKDVIPLWYNLTVQVHLPGFVPIEKDKNLTYDASITIKVKIVKDTDKIVLNSKELDLDLNAGSFRIFEDKQDSENKRAQRSSNETESENEGFNATEITTIHETKTTTERSNIVPHRNLTFEEDHNEKENDLKIKKITLNETLQFLTFHLSEKLSAGKEVYIKFAFSRKLRTTMNGLYLTKYKTENGTERLFAMTHMEPAYARGFVPCFDEPHLKAPWKIKIIHPKGTKAISNGIELEESVATKDSPDWVYTSFGETLPISSYLVAMSVNDFEYLEGESAKGTRFRVWARATAINETEYALDIGIKSIDFYEKYYGMEYPIPKQDMIAVSDFDPGAMENMGLIAFREILVLYNPKLHSLQTKYKVATTVAHEVSHQWLGNLVTMDWWNDLWLNEGTARYLEAKAVKEITNGSFQGDQMFELYEHNRAFTKDARSSSHPLHLNITSYDEVKEAFDFITYDKGASLLKMIEKIIGEKDFEKGLKDYVKKLCYKTTNSSSLFEALNSEIPEKLTGWDEKKFDLPDFANKWTEQMGYPVVELHRLDNETLEFTQRRFKRDPTIPESARYRNARYWYKWDIPLWYSVDGDEQPLAWLHEAYRLNITENQLVLVNPESIGFYRVNYDQRGWEAIQRQLLKDHTKIPVKGRHRVIDDAFILAAANHLPYEVAFNVSSYLSKETETLPWIAAMAGFNDVLHHFDDQPDSEGIREFIKSQVKPLFNNLDVTHNFAEDKDLLKSLLVANAMKVYCMVDGAECIEKAIKLFKEDFVDACSHDDIASECSRVPVTIRDTVYCEGIRWGTTADFEKIRNLTIRETTSTERSILLASLGCSRDPYVLKKAFFEGVNGTDFHDNELVSLFLGAAYGTVGKYLTNDFIMDNWKELFKRFQDTQFSLRNIVLYGLRLRDERDLKEIESFISKHKITTRRFSAWKSAIEQGKSTLNWNKHHRKSLIKFFKGEKNEKRDEDDEL